MLDHLFNHIQLLNYASEVYLEDPEALWLLHRLKKDKHLSNVDDLGYYLIEKLLEDIEKVGLRQRRSRCSLPKLLSWAQPKLRWLLGTTSIAALLSIRRMIGDDLPSKYLSCLEKHVSFLDFTELEEADL